MLNSIPGVSCVKPEGALYLFPRLDPKVYPIADDQEFILELLKAERKDLTAKMEEARKASTEANEKPKSDYRWIVDHFGFLGQAVADIQYRAMGGPGAMPTWVRRGLGNADMTHPTGAGSEVLGTWLFRALMKGYGEYRGRSRQSTVDSRQ